MEAFVQLLDARIELNLHFHKLCDVNLIARNGN